MKNPKIALIGFALFSATAAFAQNQDQAITPTARIELFNGKDFSGWQFATSGDADPKAPWKIEDGLIKCSGHPNE